MKSMFDGASAFNSSLSGWTPTDAQNMHAMFRNAIAFNQNISGWNAAVDGVTDMSSMFENANIFNQNISGWNTSDVEDMNRMFYGASAFDRDISGWNTSNVSDMSSMFENADIFDNGGVALNWTNTSNVTNMSDMFRNAILFNQDVSNWNIEKVTSMESMFLGAAAWSSTYYEAALLDWKDQTLLADVDWTNTTACKTIDIPTAFIDAGWNISDGGECEQPAEITVIATSNETVYLPLLPDEDGCTVEWGDGDITTVTTQDNTFPFHVYSSAGTYNVKITGSISQWTGKSTLVNGQADEISGPETGGQTVVAGILRPYGHTRDYWPWIKAIVKWGNLGARHIDLAGVHGLSEGSINTELPSTATSIREMFVDWQVPIPDITGLQTGFVSSFSGIFKGSNIAQNISSWNTNSAIDMSSMFEGTTAFNLDITALDTSKVIDMSYMFAYSQNYNQDLSELNVSNVTSMQSMFEGAEAYNNGAADLKWGILTPTPYPDTTAVVNMSRMFAQTTNFNQRITTCDINNVTSVAGMFDGAIAFNNGGYPMGNASQTTGLGQWVDLSAVTDMSRMFAGAIAFNASDIQYWQITNVKNMSGMFAGADIYDQPMFGSNWITSSVTDMSYMFAGAAKFNRNVNTNIITTQEPTEGLWNTSAVTNMSFMFAGASLFNQSLGNWNLSGLDRDDAITSQSPSLSARNMLLDCGISTENLDNTLEGWATPATHGGSFPQNVEFTNTTTCYDNIADRSTLINQGWNITSNSCSEVVDPGGGGGTYEEAEFGGEKLTIDVQLNNGNEIVKLPLAPISSSADEQTSWDSFAGEGSAIWINWGDDGNGNGGYDITAFPTHTYSTAAGAPRGRDCHN